MSPVAGIAAISKPAGLTSFAALSPIKRSIGSGKVGHAGTLDRFATGLLVVLAGPYSHLCPDFTSLDKVYAATALLGEETDTLDPEGEVVATAAPPSRAALEAVLPRFRGPIMQAPPAYSALHVDGERAYERALRGEEVEMKARPVTIHDLELEEYDGRLARFRVRCSSGTYIRSLARDIALAAGSRARLAALDRLAIGPLSLGEAVAPQDFDPGKDLRLLDPSLARALGLEPLRLAQGAERRFLNGGILAAADFRAIGADGEAAGPAVLAAGGEGNCAVSSGADGAVFSGTGAFLGVVSGDRSGIRYRFVIQGAA